MRKLFFNPFSLVVITGLCLLFVMQLYQTSRRTQTSQNNINRLESSVDEQQEKVSLLEAELILSETPFAQEKIIRDELLMQREGEYVVQIPDGMVQQQLEALPEVRPTPWEEWQQLLF